MSALRKGKKFWTIRMDWQGRYDVVPCLFQQEAPSHKVGGEPTKFYKLAFEFEGHAESVVVDIDAKNVFATEQEAILECIRRCWDAAASWQKRAHELLVRLSQRK